MEGEGRFADAGCAVALMMLSGTAQASPGAYKVLLAEPYEQGPHRLGAQLHAFPEITQIEYVDTGTTTPTAGELAAYDLVVSVGDSSYQDSEAWGNALAGYVEAGGIVVQTAYDNWEEVGSFGRFETGGFEPFIPGFNGNEELTLGTFDTSSPLMEGVTTLESEDNTEPELAPGASLVAKWSNGTNAVAVKGHVVSVSAFLGDGYEEEVWQGDYGRLIYNVVHTFAPKPPPVVPVIPTPTPTPVTPVAPPSNLVTVGKFKLNRKHGTGTLSVTVPDPGTLVLVGKGVRKTTRYGTSGSASLTLPVKAVGKSKKRLLANGKVSIKATLTFTPTGGTAASTTKTLVLKKKLG